MYHFSPISRYFYAIFFAAVMFFTPVFSVSAYASFRFISMSDAHVATSNFTSTVNQAKSLSPNIVLFNGDLENEGFLTTEADRMVNVLKNASVFDKTFLVRGNHDDHAANSSTLWQNYFSQQSRMLPAGVSNYTGLNSASSYLNYSFDYDNSRFIGLDSNKDADPPTSAQLTFLDSRLTDAESRGLTHAFIFFHAPEYCVESTHCSCQSATGCGPSSSFVSIINKHPIVSATFHGHEHILAWVHMNSSRVSGLTRAYEEFITSSAGNPYSFTPYPGRMDYYSYSSSKTAFGSIDVNGSNFTVNFYQTGNSTPIWTRAFSKTATGNITSTPTQVPSLTSTPTVQITTPLSRPLKYYGVDRVESMNDANYSALAARKVNTIVQYLSISSQTAWRNLVTLAEKYNMNIVIFPNQGGDVSGCGWETPFNAPVNGNYIGRVTAMLDFFNNAANWPGGKIRVIGLVSSHEPHSNQGTCRTSIADLAAIKSQLKAYVNRADFKVWSYIDNVTEMNMIDDYSSPADAEKIMDVAATWQHCFGGAEGSCPAAKTKLINDRKFLTNAGLEGKVELVFLMQTFAQGGGYVMPNYNQLLTESQNFLNTGALDGFIYYTWGACWYSTDLGCPSVNSPANSNLWPVLTEIYNQYGSSQTPVSTPTVTTFTATLTATHTPIPDKLGDANGDRVVDNQDYQLWLSHYRQEVLGKINGDLNADGKADGLDYVIWASHFGQ